MVLVVEKEGVNKEEEVEKSDSGQGGWEDKSELGYHGSPLEPPPVPLGRQAYGTIDMTIGGHLARRVFCHARAIGSSSLTSDSCCPRLPPLPKTEESPY